jgi:hypothetical protein
MLRCLDKFIEIPQKRRSVSVAILDLHDLPASDIQPRVTEYLDRFNRLITRSFGHLETELSKSLSNSNQAIADQQEDFMWLIKKANQLQAQLAGDNTGISVKGYVH